MYNGLMHLGFSNKDFLLADNSDGKGVYIAEWHSDKPQPSVEEIKTAQEEYDAEYASQDYARKREAEYPSLESVTVALAEKAEGNSAMWDEITKQRQATKAKYPKN